MKAITRWFPYDHHRVIAIKRIAEPVFAKSILRGEGNTDAGDAVEDLANFGLCDYSTYACGVPSTIEQSESEANWVSSLFSTVGNALNPIGTAQAFPIGGALGGSMGMGASGGVAGAAVGQQGNDFGWGTTQQSSNQRIANGLEQTLRKPPPLVMSASILFAMAANYYKGDSLTQQDLLEIADMGGTAPTRLRVGFASTDETAVAMAAASQLIALHTEPDSDKAQVPVIKGQLASDAERMEVISLPAYQSLGHALSRLAPIEVYRFDVGGGTQLYMGVAASGDIINISARIDDIPKGPIIHAGPSPLPQKVEKPEGFTIHESDTRPETLPIADDGIVWRHTGHDVEPVDFRDYILTVERKDVKPVYTSLNENKQGTYENPNWIPHGHKHSPRKNQSWKDTVESTKSGPAKYKPEIDIEKLERDVHLTGTPVTTDKDFKVKDMGVVIGAKRGKESQWIRVEYSAGTIHGHPITEVEYRKYTK
ncbi:hypothetical protein AB7116_17025 [Providencia manganoxydans]